MDFFALKGVVEQLLAAMNVKNVTMAARRDVAAFHPGRCAEVRANGEFLGVIGQLHPLTCRNYEMDCDVFAAQLDFAHLLAQRAPAAKYQPLPRFPSVERDIAVVCDRSVTVAELEACITRGAKGLLKQVDPV